MIVIDDGKNPAGDVTVGKARNPPPIVVPETRSAALRMLANLDNVKEVGSSSSRDDVDDEE